MHIVDMTRFAIGVGIFAVALVLLWLARGDRGFSQRRQFSLLFLVAAGLFLAKGLGWLKFQGFLG